MVPPPCHLKPSNPTEYMPVGSGEPSGLLPRIWNVTGMVTSVPSGILKLFVSPEVLAPLGMVNEVDVAALPILSSGAPFL